MASQVKYFNSQSKITLVATLLLASAIIIAISGCDPEQQKQQSQSQQVNRTWHDAPVEEEQEYTGYLPQTENTQTNYEAVSTSSPVAESSESTDSVEAGEINEKIYDEAVKSVGESSASGPGGGNVACAWFVNKILKRTIGQTVNGDSTTTMGQKFRTMVNAGKAEEVSLADAQPGDIILSPTEWSPQRNTGHVGIVGKENKVYSNSSSRKAWSQNFTKQRWQSYYGNQKGLQVKVYRILA
jgi:cell wall-associated NlpC family hydrolase